MALVLYFGLVSARKEVEDLSSLRYLIGVLMLLSAGSFIYVATIHILPGVYDTS